MIPADMNRRFDSQAAKTGGKISEYPREREIEWTNQ